MSGAAPAGLPFPVSYPCLVVSSRAGLGNHAVGEEIRRRAEPGGETFHFAVEDLLSPALAGGHFDRHRWLSERAPFYFHYQYGLPVSYALKRAREAFKPAAGTARLADIVRERGVRTVVATNHRAAFWFGSLKRRGRLQAAVWGVLTDYLFHHGWRFLFWDAMAGLVGPVPAADVAEGVRPLYREAPFFVPAALSAMSPGDPKQVLVTGGGLGLGPLDEVAATIVRTLPGATVHVVAGANRALRERMSANPAPGVVVHGDIPSLEPLLARCGVVVTRPGGVTLSEAAAARRKIFLLPGLPVIEAANARWARANFGAEDFSAEILRRRAGD